MRVRRILVPVDFTSGSHDAVRHARSIAKEFGSFVHVLYAVPRPDARAWTKKPLDSEVEPLGEQGRLQALHQLSAFIVGERLDPFRTTGLVRVGEADEVITRYANEIGADLIVMGMHGDHGSRIAGMGEVVERVLNHAPCAVLAIPDRGAGVRELAHARVWPEHVAC